MNAVMTNPFMFHELDAVNGSIVMVIAEMVSGVPVTWLGDVPDQILCVVVDVSSGVVTLQCDLSRYRFFNPKVVDHTESTVVYFLLRDLLLPLRDQKGPQECASALGLSLTDWFYNDSEEMQMAQHIALPERCVQWQAAQVNRSRRKVLEELSRMFMNILPLDVIDVIVDHL